MTEGTPIDIVKLKSLAYLRGRSSQGKNFKKTVTDELGNTVTEHWNDRQDVLVKVPKVAVSATTVEER